MDWILEGLATDPVKGISTSSIPARKKAYGTNDIPRPPPAGFFDLFLDALRDFTLMVAMFAAVISIIVNMIVDKDHRSIGSPISPSMD